eukprot:gene121-905_t
MPVPPPWRAKAAMKAIVIAGALAVLPPPAAAHSNLLVPRPRNAIDATTDPHFGDNKFMNIPGGYWPGRPVRTGQGRAMGGPKGRARRAILGPPGRDRTVQAVRRELRLLVPERHRAVPQ